MLIRLEQKHFTNSSPCPTQSWPASRGRAALHWWTACVWLYSLSPGWGTPQSWLGRKTWRRWRRWTPARQLRSSFWEADGVKGQRYQDCVCKWSGVWTALMVTYSATCESCSLVRLSGWLNALMPNLERSRPGGRLARRTALFMTLRNAPILCQPLLLNQICNRTQSHHSSCSYRSTKALTAPWHCAISNVHELWHNNWLSHLQK